MTLLTTTPSKQTIQRAEALIDRLHLKLSDLLANSSWDELQIETTALDLSSFQYICDRQDDYYNLESFLRRGKGPLAWTEDDILNGFALTPEAWSKDQREAFSNEYHSTSGVALLPNGWNFYLSKVFSHSPLQGQELIDLLHMEIRGCHYPPGCLKSIGIKRALDNRQLLEYYLFDAGYATNQVLLKGSDEEFIQCFMNIKAADKAAREQGLTPRYT